MSNQKTKPKSLAGIFAYINRGSAYAKKGDFEAAIADHTKAIELDPNLHIAYSNRGVAYAEKGDLDNAIADYSKAIALDPNDAKAYRNRADAYFKRDGFGAAV